MSRVDTSADDVRKDARATINDHVERLRAIDLKAVSEEGGGRRSECLGALSAVAELCRVDGDAGEANRMAVGEVRGCSRKPGERAARIGSRVCSGPWCESRLATQR